MTLCLRVAINDFSVDMSALKTTSTVDRQLDLSQAVPLSPGKQ